MSFNTATRLKRVQLQTLTKGTGGNTQSLILPKVGILARLYLVIRGTIAGSLSAQNALGFSSVINRIRLRANAGTDLFSVSGPSYHFLLRDFIETELVDPLGHTSGRTAVTATTFIADAIIPVQVNLRDPIGFVMLQNEQTQVTLEVEFLADASVATGATVTATVQVWMEYFSVPVSRDDWPMFDIIHQILEDNVPATSGVDTVYSWPRGNTYMQTLHGVGIAVSGSAADNWSRARLRVNQSDFLDDFVPNFADLYYYMNHGRARLLGVVPFDLLGSTGLGSYGSSRDMFNSALITDMASVITATSTITQYNVKRMLAPIA